MTNLHNGIFGHFSCFFPDVLNKYFATIYKHNESCASYRYAVVWPFIAIKCWIACRHWSCLRVTTILVTSVCLNKATGSDKLGDYFDLHTFQVLSSLQNQKIIYIIKNKFMSIMKKLTHFENRWYETCEIQVKSCLLL